MQDPVLVSQFAYLLTMSQIQQGREALAVAETAMHICALATFGRKKAKSSDWFESFQVA